MLKKIGYVTLADAVTKGIGYLLLPIYLGIMPQEEFGEFSFLLSAIVPLSLIISFSLYVPLIRNFCVAEANDKTRKDLVSTVFNSLIVWLVVINLLLILCKPLLISSYVSFFNISNFANEKYYLMLSLVSSGVILLYCYSLLISRKNTREIVVFMLVKFLLVSVSSLAFVYFGFLGHESVLNRLFGTFIAEFLVVTVYVILYVRPYISFKIDFSVLKDQLIIALPLLPSGLIGLLMNVIDRGLITEYHGLRELANYNLAMMALLPIRMLMSAVQVAWAPHLFSLTNMQKSMAQTIGVMKIAFATMCAGAILLYLAIYMALFYDFIGSEYNLVPTIIAYASIGVIASALVHLNSNMFVHLKKTNYQLTIALIVLTINWGVNVVLVPEYSFYGAVIAAGVSNSIGLIIGLVLLIKITKEQRMKHV